MRRIITTLILTLAACGPTTSDDELDITPEPTLEDDGSTSDDASTGLDGSESDGAGSSTGEPGTGGGSGEAGSDGESESTGAAPAGVCTLPTVGFSTCQAIVEAGEAIHCVAVGGRCWETVTAQYFMGDAALAQHVSECKVDCGELEDACAEYTTPATVCLMDTAADCIANATAAGIVVDDSVIVTCNRLEVLF